jgi:hypothetical protein
MKQTLSDWKKRALTAERELKMRTPPRPRPKLADWKRRARAAERALATSALRPAGPPNGEMIYQLIDELFGENVRPIVMLMTQSNGTEGSTND